MKIVNNEVVRPETTFIRYAINDLKRIGKCYCYFEWQVEEITQKYKKELNILKKDGYYILKDNLQK